MQLRGRRVFRRRQNEPPQTDPTTALLALALLAGFILLAVLFAR